MIKVAGLALATALLAAPGYAAPITYLSCDFPVTQDMPDGWHVDLTLDEQRGTVSYFVKDQNAMNEEKAAFGPDAVTWTVDGEYVKIKRRISRIDLSFIQDVETVGMPPQHMVGKCSLIDASSRKF